MTRRLTRRQAIAGLARLSAVTVLPLDAIAAVAPAPPTVTRGSIAALPPFEAVPIAFDRIPEAVVAGRVDAGLVIHEGQITYAEMGLDKLADLGEVWLSDTALPLPLGLDVVRRDLGPELMRAVSAGFRASIEAARDHEDEALRYALAFGRGLDRDRGRRFVRMYVNDHTLDMGDLGRRALDTLYRRAVAVGALAAPPPLEIV